VVKKKIGEGKNKILETMKIQMNSEESLLVKKVLKKLENGETLDYFRRFSLIKIFSQRRTYNLEHHILIFITLILAQNGTNTNLRQVYRKN